MKQVKILIQSANGDIIDEQLHDIADDDVIVVKLPEYLQSERFSPTFEGTLKLGEAVGTFGNDRQSVVIDHVESLVINFN